MLFHNVTNLLPCLLKKEYCNPNPSSVPVRLPILNVVWPGRLRTRMAKTTTNLHDQEKQYLFATSRFATWAFINFASSHFATSHNPGPCATSPFLISPPGSLCHLATSHFFTSALMQFRHPPFRHLAPYATSPPGLSSHFATQALVPLRHAGR